MAASRDPSYYEIALTNSQVRWIFVGLLVCVLVAFLGGVWFGSAQAPAVATVEPQTITAVGEKDDPPLQELEFFRGDETAERPEGTGVAALEQDARGERPRIIEQLPAAAARARQTDEPGASDREKPPVRSSAAPPASPEAIPAGAFVIQVFSSTDESQARDVLERLRSGDYPAQLSPVDVGGRPMYRVRIGPYDDREAAQQVADRVRRAYKLDTWITR